MNISILPFLDQNGKIAQMPTKRAKRYEILRYLGEKFMFDKDYTEKEVNAIIKEWHIFGDYFLLRRELVEARVLCRTKDGARYWRNQEENAN